MEIGLQLERQAWLPPLWRDRTELHFQELGKVDEEMEELRILDRGREMMDLDAFRGREGMLSTPGAEVLLREAKNFSHCSGVVHAKDKVEEGEYEQEGEGRDSLDELTETSRQVIIEGVGN